MYTLSVSIEVKNDRAVTKVYNFSVGSFRQELTHHLAYARHDAQCFYSSYHVTTSDQFSELSSTLETGSFWTISMGLGPSWIYPMGRHGTIGKGVMRVRREYLFQ